MQNKTTTQATQNKGNSVSIKLMQILIGLVFIYSCTLSAAELIFKDSFDLAFIEGIEIITPPNNQVVDQDNTLVRVRVDTVNGNIQTVEINGVLAQFVEQSQLFADYTATVPLNQGENTITAIAYYNNQSLSDTIQTSYIPLPEITITSPTDWQTLGGIGGAGGALDQSGNVQRPVTITGTLNTSDISDVQINQQQADFDSNSFTFQDFFLHEGSNLISVTATDSYGRQTSAQITVYVDQSAPFVTVENLTNRITSENTIDITGTVNDAISADVNAGEVTVQISNAATGAVSLAQVQGIHYHVMRVPLAVGNNPLTITATDALANSREISANIVRIAVGSNRITRYTGNNQGAIANSQLPQALIVNAMDKDGLPLKNLAISFDIIKGDGVISSQQNSQDLSDGVNPARNLIINTNDSGQAQIWFTVGTQAGLANNLIHAYSPSIAEGVYFTATTLLGVATKVQIEGASGTQYAQTNSQPVEALTVVVSDENDNPIANTEVTFSIDQGDAYFKANSALAGQLQATNQSIQTTTDNKGQASVRPYIGTTASNIVITATTPNTNTTPNGTARFNIIALKRTDGPTSLTGIAMDHTGTPIAGIKFSIARTQLTAISDDQGYFEFPSQVPTGKIDLFVDGRDVQIQQAGVTVEYPALHFETAIIQGQQNQLPHPVYLPPVHIENTQMVGGNQDVTLTLPNFEGFKMIVKAGSVTFPDGSTQGELVVNPVNNDRLPMVPPGTGGRFMATGWTLQPSGTRFDPPIEVHIPNTDGLKPGTVVPVVQWDHDMAFFVPMGLGTISEDGSELVTNAGSGITKAGWGGGPPPPPPEDEAEKGCELSITANGENDKLWEIDTESGLDVTFRAKFTGNSCSNSWEYYWEIPGGTGPEESDEASPTQHYDEIREYIVSLQVTCEDCTPNYLEDFYSLEVFVPVVKIKKAEQKPFELIKEGSYYLERTNLEVEVQYPRQHPEAGEIISDYSGEAKITEESSTQYYNNEDGASDLPKDDLAISSGKAKISLDSVSDEYANSGGANNWPKDAKIKIEIEEFEYLNIGSIKEIDVKQWVADSSADLGGANDSGTPDWLEKAVWDKINEYKSQSGIVGTVFKNINKVKLAEKDKALILAGAECGRTPEVESEVHNIYIGETCHIGGSPNRNMHRKNTNDRVKLTTLMQARLAWQAAQRFTTPDNATGANPKNDSDGDGCPEVILVSDETEADIHDATPIQDGAPPTQVPGSSTERNPDNIANNTMHSAFPYSPWSTKRVSKCHYLLKTDAIQFMRDHN